MPALTFDPPEPQEGDSELTIDHKTAVNVATMASAINSNEIGAAIAAAIGTADDEANDPTVIGLLKQIVINTTA